MKIQMKIAAVALMGAALGGCGQQEISCANGQPIALQIANSKMPPQLMSMSDMEMKLDVADVRTTNETKFVAECAANLSLLSRKKDTSDPLRPASNAPITYRVERTQDGNLYVTVFGL